MLLFLDVSTDENVYIYGFGGAVTFVMMLFGIYYKIRYYKSRNIIISQVPETNQLSEVNRFESVYDEIDELALDDMNQQSNLNNTSVEDDSSNSSGTTNSGTSNNEGYLNPYQPIIHNAENHKYSLTSAVVSSTQEKREDHICEKIYNETYVNVIQDEITQKSSNYPDSQSLNYSDIPIDTEPVTIALDRYENTRIF
ncbi:unnamed protein product [Mytilus coruscus]|uniref:Uncharacterized protein n=1 Tax=Mytilus coruscus TaxID=42192 RepID=A0A6J8DZC1_MYTCO|nr:unnamed protein product [Mytilus coruscus]